MSDIEKILAIVGIIWLAHIPFVVPFILAARQASSSSETDAATQAKPVPESATPSKLVASL